MRHAARAVLAFGLCLAGTGVVGAAGADDPGICARCHETETALSVGAGGHSPSLDCVVCHADRRPGIFGHGHRKIPTSCTTHHVTTETIHPVPAHAFGPGRTKRRCLTCHDPHGSPNAHLIRTTIRVGNRFRPIDFHDAGGAVPGGFVDPTAPGHGLCEVCHRDTRFFPANGRGETHFTSDCALCHDHGVGFQPVVSDANCTICHADEAARLAKTSLHHDRFTGRCSSCHAEAAPAPGPGHRTTSACLDCHAATRVAGHMPPGGPTACTQCHEPHGSDNARLVRDVIRTPQGDDRPVRFDDALTGQADGSFASASAPGTGLCEACHTRTQFYRADGGGAAHYTTLCTRCHPHSAGFAPN